MPALSLRLVSLASKRKPRRWPGRVASRTITCIVPVAPEASSRLSRSTRFASVEKSKADAPSSSEEARGTTTVEAGPRARPRGARAKLAREGAREERARAAADMRRARVWPTPCRRGIHDNWHTGSSTRERARARARDDKKGNRADFVRDERFRDWFLATSRLKEESQLAVTCPHVNRREGKLRALGDDQVEG